MAGSINDILTAIQNGIIAANNLVVQMKGSFLNISSQLGRRITTVQIQSFTGNGTYTPTPGMLYCVIECVGGGGAGGGLTTFAGQRFMAGAGGGGSYSRKLATA